MKQEEIKFKIKLDYQQAWQGVEDFRKKMEMLNKEQEKLNQQFAKGTLSSSIFQQNMTKNVESINKCKRSITQLSTEFVKLRANELQSMNNVGTEGVKSAANENRYMNYTEELQQLIDELQAIHPQLAELTKNQADELDILAQLVDSPLKDNDSSNKYSLQNSLFENKNNYDSFTSFSPTSEDEVQRLENIQIEADERVYTHKQELANEQKLQDREQQHSYEQQIQQRVAMSEQMLETMSVCIDTLAEKSEAFATFSKAMALFQIGIDTATALSKGIASAQVMPFPGNLAAIVTTTTAILANIAKAKQYLSESSLPSYATGGLIDGIGTGTSDSIPARVSAGESVLTAKATAMFAPILSSFNQIGGGVPISTRDTAQQVMGEEMLTRAFLRAIKQMPSPTVSVREIEQIRDRQNSTRAFEV